MVFTSLSAGGTGANIDQVVCRIRGSIERSALEHAARHVVARHAALRTRFVWHGRAEPAQELVAGVYPAVTFQELSGSAELAREPALQLALDADRRADFALDCAPLFRVACLELGGGECAVVLTSHHIVADRASLAVIARDLFAAYDAYAHGNSPNGEPARDAVEAAVQPPRVLSGEGEAYFRGLLGDVAARTPLEVGFVARNGAVHGQGRRVQCALSADETSTLVDAAAQLECNPRSLIEAAWGLLLKRYSGSEDVLFAVAASGRSSLSPADRAAVGCYVHTLPRRLRVGPELSVGAFVDAVEEQHEAALPYECTSLRDIQGCSQIPAGMPLFDSLVSFEQHALRDEIATLHVQRVDHQWQTTLPLTLVAELGASLELTLGFDPARYDRDTAARLLKHLRVLLCALGLSTASTALGALTMLDADEQAELTHGWNDTLGSYPDTLRIHELFEQQATQHPERVALVCGEEQLGFGELETRANRLANTLIAAGVGRFARVGICMPRCAGTVVAMLAVLKSGAAYVPLDPAYPEDRVRFMLEDSAASVVITMESLLSVLPAEAATYVVLDRDATRIARASAERPEPRSEPDDVAYIIYTSGSTGRPKGVVVRHRPALNLMDWVNGTFAVGPSDRLLFVTSICFDLSVYDVFGALGAGASIHVARSEELREPRALVRLLEGGTITIWDSAPAALTQLVPFLPARADGSALRHVMLSGDWIPVPLPDQIRTAFPRARIVSLGGATEATVWSNYFEIEDVPAHWPSIPYGRPIRNARYYVLDARLQPMPIGAPGELHIGGACLADGYLNRPELSAEKFIADPHARTPNGKLYKTGDLARFMPDGNLEFLGRIDQQVKVRGFRVELGEIESVLNQHPAVASALVDAPRLTGAERTLVAYVVAHDAAQKPDVAELRVLCQHKLAEYMVPAHFMLLDALPMTANGKVDRRALPTPASDATAAYVAPRSPLEVAVVEVVQTMLQAKRVGVLDHFFELGGHSLLAVRVVGELSRRYGVELSLAAFLALPTAEALAKLISAGAASSESRAPRMITADASAPALVSLDQRRLAFVQGLYPNSPVYNLTFAFRLEGPVDVGKLRQALEVVVARHEPLRTGFRASLDGYAAEILAQAHIELPNIDLSGLPEAARAEALAADARLLSRQPFDLSAPPLVRALLATLSTDEHMLVLVIHHIVFDGASTPILVRELTAAYDALMDDREHTLPALAIRFNDAARHQLEHVGSGDFTEDLAYWRKALAGDLSGLQLPADRARPRVFNYRGAVEPWSLSAEYSTRLRQLAQSRRASTFTLLLAAYHAYLVRCSGQRDVVVGIPVALRDQPEAAQLIGLLLNTLPIRAALNPGASFDAFQADVRARVLEALEHRHLPFERIVAALNPPRDPSTTPIFQALFSHQEVAGGLAQSKHFGLRSTVVDQCFAATELSFFTEDCGERGIQGYFSYSCDLWEPATAQRMVAGFAAFLEHVIDHPERDLDSVPAMATSQRALEVHGYNDTRSAYDLSESVVDLFEARARVQSDRIAVVSDRGQLSYGELSREVVRMANTLRELGAAPGVGVAVALGRSPRMLVALLAIMRTGAHYIPLDPSHPEERNQRILRVAKPALVMIEDETRQSINAPETSVVVNLDAALSEGPAFDPHANIDPHGIAYIIFTSGSTGDPKGVEVPRDALTNFLLSMADRPGMSAEDRILALTTISFDIAGLELFLPLLVGGSIDIADRELALDPIALAARLRDRRITVFQATPAYYRMLLESGWQGQSDLKVLCGGEAFPPEIVRALLPRVASVWNMYGPTETTVWSSIEQLTSAEGPISIGRPIANTEMYVLNDALEPVPTGVTGMLWIGGDGVALGYHGRPDLTDAAFVADPFSGRPGARIYRTGDLARRIADGRLECLGRNDFQVKIRGYRIELGEIEAVLLSHAEVLQAVVHLKAASNGDKRLVGYVVRHDHSETVPADLTDHLKARLPPYMVPNAFVAMAALPLTPNGKVDRKALPEPAGVTETRGRESISPRNDVEVKVAEIFARLLGLPTISIYQSFFDAGGHSLLAVRVTREVNAAFGIDLSIGVMFEDPSVSGLAAAIRAGGGSLGSAVLPLHAGSEAKPIYFICGIQLYQKLARMVGDSHASYGLFVPAEDKYMRSGAELTDLSISHLASAYVEAIEKHRPHGPLALVGVSFGGLLAFEVARQLRALGREVGSLTLIDTVLPDAMRRNWPAWLAYRMRKLRSEGVGRAFAALKTKLAPTRAIDVPAEESRDNHLWRLLNSSLVGRYFANTPTYAGPTLVIRAELRDEVDSCYDVDDALGWHSYLTGPVTLTSSPADHLGTLLRRETADAVRAHVERHTRFELRRTSVPPPPSTNRRAAG